MTQITFFMGEDCLGLGNHLQTVWGWKQTTKQEMADVLVLAGGSDITPEIYGQINTECHDVDLERDQAETYMFTQALVNNQFVLGVCRGAQLVSALCGYSLIQHIDTHYTTHDVLLTHGSRIKTSSLHHQCVNFVAPNTVSDTLLTVKLLGAAHMNAKDALQSDLLGKVAYQLEIGLPTRNILVPEIWYIQRLCSGAMEPFALCTQGHPECGPLSYDLVVQKAVAAALRRRSHIPTNREKLTLKRVDKLITGAGNMRVASSYHLLLQGYFTHLTAKALTKPLQGIKDAYLDAWIPKRKVSPSKKSKEHSLGTPVTIIPSPVSIQPVSDEQPISCSVEEPFFEVHAAHP